MILKETSQKVYLISKDGQWEMMIGGKNYIMDESVERAWVFYIFGHNGRNEVIEWMRDLTKKDLTPIQIDAAIEMFKFLHKAEYCGRTDFSDVPLYADKDRGMCLPIPGYSCVISLENERELMQMIIDRPYKEVLGDMELWFKRYCYNYSLNYEKFCKGQQFKYLVSSFLEQHGISKYGWPLEKTASEAYFASKGKKKPKEFKSTSPFLFILGIILMPIIGWLLLCVDITDPFEFSWLEFIINTIGALLFIGPLLIFFK